MVLGGRASGRNCALGVHLSLAALWLFAPFVAKTRCLVIRGIIAGLAASDADMRRTAMRRFVEQTTRNYPLTMNSITHT